MVSFKAIFLLAAFLFAVISSSAARIYVIDDGVNDGDVSNGSHPVALRQQQRHTRSIVQSPQDVNDSESDSVSKHDSPSPVAQDRSDLNLHNFYSKKDHDRNGIFSSNVSSHTRSSASTFFPFTTSTSHTAFPSSNFKSETITERRVPSTSQRPPPDLSYSNPLSHEGTHVTQPTFQDSDETEVNYRNNVRASNSQVTRTRQPLGRFRNTVNSIPQTSSTQTRPNVKQVDGNVVVDADGEPITLIPFTLEDRKLVNDIQTSSISYEGQFDGEPSTTLRSHNDDNVFESTIVYPTSAPERQQIESSYLASRLRDSRETPEFMNEFNSALVSQDSGISTTRKVIHVTPEPSVVTTTTEDEHTTSGEVRSRGERQFINRHMHGFDRYRVYPVSKHRVDYGVRLRTPLHPYHVHRDNHLSPSSSATRYAYPPNGVPYKINNFPIRRPHKGNNLPRNLTVSDNTTSNDHHIDLQLHGLSTAVIQASHLPMDRRHPASDLRIPFVKYAVEKNRFHTEQSPDDSDQRQFHDNVDSASKNPGVQTSSVYNNPNLGFDDGISHTSSSSVFNDIRRFPQIYESKNNQSEQELDQTLQNSHKFSFEDVSPISFYRHPENHKLQVGLSQHSDEEPSDDSKSNEEDNSSSASNGHYLYPKIPQTKEKQKVNHILSSTAFSDKPIHEEEADTQEYDGLDHYQSHRGVFGVNKVVSHSLLPVKTVHRIPVNVDSETGQSGLIGQYYLPTNERGHYANRPAELGNNPGPPIQIQAPLYSTKFNIKPYNDQRHRHGASELVRYSTLPDSLSGSNRMPIHFVANTNTSPRKPPKIASLPNSHIRNYKNISTLNKPNADSLRQNPSPITVGGSKVNDQIAASGGSHAPPLIAPHGPPSSSYGAPPASLSSAAASYGPPVSSHGGGHRKGVTGPVFTFAKTDYHGNVKWGVRHKVGSQYAGHKGDGGWEYGH